MEASREISRVFKSRAVLEGAGVRLKRVFGFGGEYPFDPFLLLDHFGSDDPRDYLAGFPWHPHRGIETVTYLLQGEVEHQDSLGNKGSIRPGEVQWMTAGSGILHQEMPKAGEDGRSMEGFQLWVNLPRANKMSRPRYRGVAAGDIPVIAIDGARVHVIAGAFRGQAGPVTELYRPATYLDLRLEAGAELILPAEPGLCVAVYAYRGELALGKGRLEAGSCALLGPGGGVRMRAGESGCACLFVAGEPLRESVAWRGPIVMNTEEELERAWRDLDEGTFIKEGGTGI